MNHPDFIAALQALMREYGATEIYATTDGSVLVVFADKTTDEFWSIDPEDTKEVSWGANA